MKNFLVKSQYSARDSAISHIFFRFQFPQELYLHALYVIHRLLSYQKRSRCEIFGFFSSHSLKTREKYISFAQFVFFFEGSVSTFQVWMIKLKSKHTSLKKYTYKLIHFSLVLRERVEKTKYFAPILTS